MNTEARVMMLAVGLALAMLTVTSLMAALNLSFRELEATRQQASAWETYALSLHRRDLFEAGSSVAEAVEPHGRVVQRLGIVAMHPPRPGFRF